MSSLASGNELNLEPTDEEKIRALIQNWCIASTTGDLEAQLGMMDDDVAFLTPGKPPLSREDFANGFSAMMKSNRLVCHIQIHEITIKGDLAVCWNDLTVNIFPLAGGDPAHRAGSALTILRRGTDSEWRIWRDANLLAPTPQ